MKYLLHSDSGQVLIEFAVISTLFILLFAGIVDYGIYIHHEIELTESSATGATLATYPFQQEQTASQQELGTLSTEDIPNASVTATYFYTCTPGGTQVASTAICNANYDYRPLMYVQVVSSAPVPAALRWAGISSNLSLSGTSIYRVPWAQ